jgi:hypothetical protein
MKSPTLSNHLLLLSWAVLCCARVNSSAFTFSLHEQGGLTGFVNGGGGTVTVNPLGTDHWQVFVQDSRIGNSNAVPLSLAYIEPELVGAYTAYNNIQVLSVVPGTAVFDVLSDEISPYSTIMPDGGVAPIQPTDNETIYLRFTDTADMIPEPSSISLLLGGSALLLFRRSGWRRQPGVQGSEKGQLTRSSYFQQPLVRSEG